MGNIVHRAGDGRLYRHTWAVEEIDPGDGPAVRIGITYDHAWTIDGSDVDEVEFHVRLAEAR